MQAPLPQNEPARLQALRGYGILNTAAEAEFDDFTLLAAHICGTPMALISLVDAGRQWFKSKLGFDAAETPREQAFCAHALHQPGVFLVPDAAEDARFSDNPLVTGDAGIRFYAGAPLITDAGEAIGTLCVLDTVPRTLTPAQQSALCALSRQVIARLELRREAAERAEAEQARRDSEALKSAILQSALDCIVTINQQGCIVEWNPAAVRTFGYSLEDALGQDLAELIVPPALRAAHRQGMAHFLKTSQGPVLHKRIEISAVRAGGAEFPVELAITPIPLGNETLFTATLRDISERKEAEAALKTAHAELETRVAQRTQALASMQRQNKLLLDSAGEGIYGLDLQGITLFVNPAAARMLGYEVSELIGQPMHALLHHSRSDGSVYPVDECPIYNCIRTGAACQSVEEVFWHKDGTAVDVEYTSTPLSENGTIVGAVVTFRCITERKQAMEALWQSGERLRTVVENAPILLFSYDAQGILTLIEGSALNQIKTAPGMNVGHCVFDVYQNRPEVIENARRVLSGESVHATRQMGPMTFDVRLQPLRDAQGSVTGAIGVATDITQQARAEQKNYQLHADLTNAYNAALNAYDATIEGWSRALDLRDHETEGHSLRVTEMTLRLARAVGLPESEMVHIKRGALLHDIGKMGVPDAVLLKPGPLDDDEWEIMRRHPSLAKALLDPAEFLRPALTIPYCHHEKWDGTGYPQGLCGSEIPLAARLFALVDVWDALTSNRPYRAAWPRDRVLDHLQSLAGTHFDPQIISVFLRMLQEDSRPSTQRLAA